VYVPDFNVEGEEEGVQMKEFDYTGKMLVSIGKYERMVNDEVNCVRCLPITKRRKQKWAGTINRPPIQSGQMIHSTKSKELGKGHVRNLRQ
jgi:hypothetical protein